MRTVTPRQVLIFLVLLTVLTALWSLVLEFHEPAPDLPGWAKNYLQNFSTGTLGAIVTFLLVDLLLARRDRQLEKEAEEKELKAQLIADMRSEASDTVATAIGQLTEKGWHKNGSLREAILVKANVQGQDLSFADLCGAHLTNANLARARLVRTNLSDAQLDWSNLQDANLTGATVDGASLWKANLTGVIGVNNQHLSKVRMLRGATLPDGKKYDGRFNLPGDFEKAESARIDLEDPKALAAWYSITLEEYLAGQKTVKCAQVTVGRDLPISPPHYRTARRDLCGGCRVTGSPTCDGNPTNADVN
jgi:hypothetical protein